MITLDEAIEILSRPKTMKGTPQDILEAHDMAITALRQPEHLTDDDFETIRIHLSAFKESLCNQRRWKEAEDYERLISRFMSFASSQSKIAQNISDGDLISRKAAIGACLKGKTDGLPATNVACDCCAERIRVLPSVQPEKRTCVNCGRTANNGGWYADGGTRCPIEEHYALPKDGYCHLWEKRSVTDDDYPERRTDDE